jgi:regulator of protease activity HflC (stomatin/prohibitin superfamily)
MGNSPLSVGSVPLTPSVEPGGNGGENKDDPREVVRAKIFARWMPYVSLTIYVALFVVAWFKTSPDSIIKWWMLVITAAFCHLVLGSFKIIREQEMAVLIFYGTILKEWKSGLHYALWPFFYIRKETKNSIQVDFGTLDDKKVEEIERARRAESSQSWYVMTEPVRIIWGDITSLNLAPSNLSEEDKVKYIEAQLKRYANDPYANTMTTDPHFYFRIKIINLQGLIEEVGGLKEALERIKVTCIRALSEEAGKTFVAKARQELGTLSKLILERVEDLVGDPNPDDRSRPRINVGRFWGIDVEEAAIQDIGAPHAANAALAERAATIAKADGQAIATIRTATANQEKLTKEGAGQAAAITSLAQAEFTRLSKEGEGKAAALKAVAKAATKQGAELVMRIEATKAVMTASGGKIVVVPVDGAPLMGAMVGAVEAIKEAVSPSAKPVKTAAPSK